LARERCSQRGLGLVRYESSDAAGTCNLADAKLRYCRCQEAVASRNSDGSGGLRRQLSRVAAGLCRETANCAAGAQARVGERMWMRTRSLCRDTHFANAQKLFIRMKRPTPIAGPTRVATTIMTKGFAAITLPRTELLKVHSQLPRPNSTGLLRPVCPLGLSFLIIRGNRAAPLPCC